MGSLAPTSPSGRLLPADPLGAGRLLLLVLALASAGCVKVYQPLSGLHRPVVVDPQAPNLRDLRIRVVCVPGELVSAEESRTLCRKVGTLFENQGAAVTTFSADRRWQDEVQDAGAEPTETDLAVELSARLVNRSNHPLSWVLCLATLTIVPAVHETTFAQDVVVRDGTGFLLARDTFEGRMLRYVGAGSFVGNRILDLAWREKDEKLIGSAHRDLSTDYYRQLSQLVFNAKMQWQVLREANPSPRAP